MHHNTLKNLLSISLLGFCLAVGMAFSLPTYAENNNTRALFNSLVNNEDSKSFLSPDLAFKLALKAVDASNVEAAFKVAPGYYLYRERIKFTVLPPADITSTTLPAGEIKLDPNFGKQEVYHHDFIARIKLLSTSSQPVKMTASYQGCSEKGLCYAPIKKTFTVNLPQSNNGANHGINNIESVNDDDRTVNSLKSGNLWLVIAGFFVAGLLLSLTPCVLPMIPILSSIIVGSQSKQALTKTGQPSKLHAFGLSAAYVLGMALSYTLAGIAAGLSGSLLSQSLQNPWVLGTTALLFIIFAFSMFGFYELKLPANFESKMLSSSNKLKGGEFLGVFIMGVLSALIVSPCVAAPLAGALIYIGQTHNVLLGGAGLFALAIGMGVPLLLIGASAGSLLPKTGNWMNAVRNFFGTLMLGMAIWIISPVIPANIQLWLWAILLIVNAIFLNALDTLPINVPVRASNMAKFWKGIAVILLLVGVAFVFGALSGAKSPFQPFSGLINSNAVRYANNTASQNPLSQNPLQINSALPFTRIKNMAELNKQLANTNGQPVMLDFYADWCVACKELENFTFSHADVQRLLQNTVLLQVDVTANTDEDKALLKRFALYGPPGIIFFDGSGHEINAVRTIGFQDADRFIKTLGKRDACLTSTTSKSAALQC